ncbi:MAG: hypothetical protein U0797_15970 [Gemmataceae bacterium]
MNRLIQGVRTALRNLSVSPARAKRSRYRPSLESLEGRSVPAAFSFSTGLPDGQMAVASQPAAGRIEIEAADDFILAARTQLNHASFTGLLPAGTKASDVKDVVVEIYRVFGKDSNLARTPHVPTRANSPSDVAFADREAGSGLSFGLQVLNPHFVAANSVVNGIHPSPHQRTGGEGRVSGEEVRFNVTFNTPLTLPADHYFFVPQVQLKGGNGHFLWLSAPPKQFAGDLQAWVRNDKLQPDWLRVGTDIVGGPVAPTFNASFSLTGQTVSGLPRTSVSGVIGSPSTPQAGQAASNPDGLAGVLAALLKEHR